MEFVGGYIEIPDWSVRRVREVFNSEESGEGLFDPMDEADAIRAAMLRWTQAKYNLLLPNPRDPPSSDSEKWLIIAAERSQAKLTFHARAVWEDNAGTVWVESFLLGNTIDLIELTYGEEGLIESDYLDLTEFFKPEVRDEFGDRFPIAYAYLLGYEKILAVVSARRNVQLQMGYVGDVGGAVFYMEAKIERANLDFESKLEKIRLSVLALKEALKGIEIFEMEMEREVDRIRPPIIGVRRESRLP
jgi:hypothetical protein